MENLLNILREILLKFREILCKILQDPLNTELNCLKNALYYYLKCYVKFLKKFCTIFLKLT